MTHPYNSTWKRTVILNLRKQSFSCMSLQKFSVLFFRLLHKWSSYLFLPINVCFLVLSSLNLASIASYISSFFFLKKRVLLMRFCPLKMFSKLLKYWCPRKVLILSKVEARNYNDKEYYHREVRTPTKGLKNLFKAVLWYYFVYIDV